MSVVATITNEQADLLAGQEYAPACHYNPVQDCDGNWLITTEEIEQTTNPDFLWVKQLPLSEWCPPVIEEPSFDTPNYFDQFFSGNTKG